LPAAFNNNTDYLTAFGDRRHQYNKFWFRNAWVLSLAVFAAVAMIFEAFWPSYLAGPFIGGLFAIFSVRFFNR